MGISAALGSSALLPAGLGFRNKLMNGGMVIAQRGTAAVTGSGSDQWAVDRWLVFNGTGTVTFQQSTTAPAGFTNSIVATVTATGSYGTSGYTAIAQRIEGYNVADCGFGTASAKQLTLSFWVRASVTGTYTVSFSNSAGNRFLYRSFSVSAANTWEYKTVNFIADTSGTWLTDNGIGLTVSFQLGRGTGSDGTENTWSSSAVLSTSGSVDFAANSSATFYLTGVQLEQNYQPTPFEQRPIGVELQLCQRYFQIFGTSSVEQGFGSSYFNSAVYIALWVERLITQMRAAPAITFTTPGNIYNVNTATTYTGVGWVLGSTSDQTFYVYTTTAIGTANGQSLLIYGQRFSLSAEL